MAISDTDMKRIFEILLRADAGELTIIGQRTREITDARLKECYDRFVTVTETGGA
jgi:hypothetical protein